jgi:hypothetical protein
MSRLFWHVRTQYQTVVEAFSSWWDQLLIDHWDILGKLSSSFEPLLSLSQNAETQFWNLFETILTCCDQVLTVAQVFFAFWVTVLNSCWDFLEMLRPSIEILSRHYWHVVTQFYLWLKFSRHSESHFWTLTDTFSACQEFIGMLKLSIKPWLRLSHHAKIKYWYIIGTFLAY